MNVLVIPEDFRKDQYILKPLFERLLRSMGRQNARVRVCQDPLLGGIGEAMKSDRIAEIVERYGGMTDVFVLCVDRDGERGRRRRLDAIEQEFGNGRDFLAENAWEELGTWVLAGLILPRSWRWADVRAEVQVKEEYFDKLAKRRSVADGPGGGRRALGEEAASKPSCTEDERTHQAPRTQCSAVTGSVMRVAWKAASFTQRNAHAPKSTAGVWFWLSRVG